VPRALIANATAYIDNVNNMIIERERSDQLLEAAKRSVEIAIEDSESAALTYVKEVME
jgi:hypothetical protein